MEDDGGDARAARMLRLHVVTESGVPPTSLLPCTAGRRTGSKLAIALLLPYGREITAIFFRGNELPGGRPPPSPLCSCRCAKIVGKKSDAVTAAHAGEQRRMLTIVLPRWFTLTGMPLPNSARAAAQPVKKRERGPVAVGLLLRGRTEDDGGDARAARMLHLHVVTESSVPPTSPLPCTAGRRTGSKLAIALLLPYGREITAIFFRGNELPGGYPPPSPHCCPRRRTEEDACHRSTSLVHVDGDATAELRPRRCTTRQEGGESLTLPLESFARRPPAEVDRRSCWLPEVLRRRRKKIDTKVLPPKERTVTILLQLS
nr:hypothetical protein Iba_chr02fCG11010 [Ipomoea batatas]